MLHWSDPELDKINFFRRRDIPLRLSSWLTATVGFLGTATLLAGPALAAPAASSPSTVVVGLFEEPTTLNPVIPQAGVVNGEVQDTLFRNLFMQVPSGALRPDLATVVPTVANGGISKNGLVYTFHMKSGLKWSNGSSLTTRDVWETYKLMTNPTVTPGGALGWSDIRSFEILSNTAFRITLDTPFAPLLVTIFSGPGIVPYSVFHNLPAKDVDKASWNSAPTLSDGPYMFKSWVSGAALTVVRNPDWHGPKPKSARIVFKIVPNQNSLLVQAEAGSINIWPDFPVNYVSQVKSIAGAEIHAATGVGWEAPVVNFRDPIMENLDVREALELSVNRAALVKALYHGYAKVAVADQAPNSWGFNHQLKPWAYSPSEAKVLLNKAGWKVGAGGFRYKDGKELTITYVSTSGSPVRQEIERLVSFWWRAIGVNVQIKNYPANVLFGNVLPSGKGWDLAELESTGGGDPAVLSYDIFGTKQFLNFGNYSNTKVNQLLEAAIATPVQARRAADFQAAEVILRNTLPMLYYYYPEALEATFHVTGFTQNPWASDTWDCWNWVAQ